MCIFFFCFRFIRDERPTGARYDVRLRVCQFAIDVPLRTILLTALPVLLPKEHPVLLPLPGKVTVIRPSRELARTVFYRERERERVRGVKEEEGKGKPNPYIMHLCG